MAVRAVSDVAFVAVQDADCLRLRGQSGEPKKALCRQYTAYGKKTLQKRHQAQL